MAAPWRTWCFRSAAHGLGAGGVVTGELDPGSAVAAERGPQPGHHSAGLEEADHVMPVSTSV